jgi:hypothetical protein
MRGYVSCHFVETEGNWRNKQKNRTAILKDLSNVTLTALSGTNIGHIEFLGRQHL